MFKRASLHICDVCADDCCQIDEIIVFNSTLTVDKEHFFYQNNSFLAKQARLWGSAQNS